MIRTGNNIIIDYLNNYYDHMVELCLKYYDTVENNNSVIVLGSYVKKPITEIKKNYINKKIIIYQTEQLFGGKSWHNTDIIIKNMIGADEIWEFDLLNVKYLKDYFNIKTDRFLPLRYVPTLDKNLDITNNYDIDVLFYGTVNERRFQYIYKIQHWFLNNLKIMTLIGVTGDYLDDCIRRSKIILNIHPFEPYNRQEQVRLFYPIINGKCVISEFSQINNLGNTIIESDWDNLGRKIEFYLKDDKFLEIGKNAREKFKENTIVNYDNHVKDIIKLGIKHGIDWNES